MFQEIQGFQLSPQQKYLWQLQQSDSRLYQVKAAVSITGNLNIELLRKAVEKVVSRHEILRTCYKFLPEMTIPVQVITDSGANWQQNYDLSNYTNEEQAAKIQELFQQFGQQNFNLETGEVLHISLVTLSATKYILFIRLPGLSADRETLKILVREISDTYADKYDHHAEIMQYADLAMWQNELLSAADTEAGREYWTQQDFSALQALQLPIEKENVAELVFQPQTHSFTLDSRLVSQIETQHQSSIANFFLACWNILLWRITGQDNLVLGMSTNGRKYLELESSLGLLSKYVPLKCELRENITLSSLLNQLNQAVTENYNYQEYFSPDTLTELAANNQVIFPVSFDYDEIIEKHNFDDVVFSISQIDVCIDTYKLKLACIRRENLIELEFTYNSNYFLTADIQRLAEQLKTLIENAISHPEAAISRLQILGNSEINLLSELNNTKLAYPVDRCIHHLFEEQVAKTPDQIAIAFAEQQLTYRELNNRANQIAHRLQQLGVGAEVLVGLCVERSLDFVLGILGILKAGGAYVPLDPTYPQERLAYMLQNSQPKVLLTKEFLIKDLPNHSAQVVCLDKDSDLITQQPIENLHQTAVAANLAYVIYTSGSTGTPKGVRVTHANLCHYVQAMQTALGIVAADKYLHTASIAFSSSVRQLMVPLTKGATIVIATSEQRKDPLTLFAEIKQQQVTVIDIVPSYWRNCNHLLSSLKPEVRTNLLDNKLRLIVSASEPLLSDICTQWRFGLQHNASLINMFGQTETCGIVAVNPIAHNDQIKIVPLGRPIANTQIYILDKYLQPVPMGVAGELYIGGLGIGQGYLHRPDLTAERFIPNPFSEEGGTRLYKTGDLGRYLPDGKVEFIGRSDYQVKIRGFRIELAEIEAVLCQHPSVREAVVVAREDSREKKLVAYLVSNEQSLQDGNFSNCRSFLQERLPDYMMPANFVMLEKLPLTPNGKINRQALPAPEQLRLQTHSQKAPRTPIEEVIAGIWAQILNVGQVNIDDNFFELGGHSLLATQIVSQLREAFSVDLPLRSLFEYPTVAALAESIEIALKTGEKLQLPPIEKAPRDGVLPLSFAQTRLWFLEQLEPGNSTYNLCRTLKLQGALNVTALEESLNEIIRRHEILRTTFTSVDGQAVQVINADLSLKIQILNLQNLSPQAQELEVQRLVKQAAQQSFDLSTPPLFKTLLLQLAAQEYLLIFTIHHIIADGWSAGVIISELAALYESFCTGKSSPLGELSIQYGDFAVWQHQWLQGEIFQQQMDYWKQQLSGTLPVLELPTDRPRSAIQTFAGKKQFFTIPHHLTSALKTLSQQEGVTLFMTLLAAFQTLLYRYTGQEDILIGSPIANRNRAEIEELIGFFVNTIVLRTNLLGKLSFRELLKQVREVTLGAYAHQDLPFEQLVEELQPERNLSHTPLFQVMFALQNAPMGKLKLPDLNIQIDEVDIERSQFDLTLFLTETNQGLTGAFEYNSDLFDADTIIRMQGHFQTLLQGVVANPEQYLSNLPILTEPELHHLLIEQNHTQTNYPSVCIHQLFEAQVEKTPDAVAVVFENQQLTYRELNQRANQLAHYLQKLGVEPEVLVGICVERSLEMIVGLLGILKAGGAYVPLDPAYPQKRLGYMLANSQLSVLLTQKLLLENLPPHHAQVVCLDVDLERISQQNTSNLTHKIAPENLAYVIYTSGSTGKPKGVQISHSAVVNFLMAMRQTPEITQQDILLSVTTLSFDIAALEIYLPLIVGAQLVLVSREETSDGIQLAKRLTSSGATVMQATPATWRMLMAAGWSGNQQLKILCGGEALDATLAQQLQQRGKELWNLYGPTETTIWSAVYQVENTIAVGHPIANTQFYILDAYNQPVPIGVAGELHIGGAGLARGYLHQPELTAQKFISNPFNPDSASRLYKTGDLVRYRSDRTIEFLGRIDNQVKLRGFRIELGEIESLLNQHPFVQASVVIVREDEPGDKSLVAYVVLKPEQTLTLANLRGFLAEKVPNYMLPSAFVTLEKLPLTPNGKIDRRALPAPDTTRNLARIFLAPRNFIEEVIAETWQQVLGIKQVSINDNFFELGGHSLLATQVISRLRKILAIDLSLRYLFASPTIAELAKTIQQTIKAQLGLNIPPIQPVCRNTNLPLSFAQARLWLQEQLYPGSFTYNISAGVRLTGFLNVAALAKSLNEIVRRHEVLRSYVSLVNEQALQAIAPNFNVNLPIIDLSDLPTVELSTEVQRLAIEESQRTFDLTQAPLLRCTLLHLNENEYIALLTIHHIVSDGWSMGVLIQELTTLYTAFCTGKTSPLPELPIQYADFAVWQRQWLQGEVLQTQLDFWQQELNNLPILELPTDFPSPPQRTFRGAKQTLILPKSLSKGLKQLSTNAGVTLFMTLLTGFQTLLHYYTNQDDIVVGTDVANRNQAETEALIGFFVNQLVLRTDMTGNPSVRELLERVRDRTLSAYTHQDLPFDKLVEVLNPERDFSRSPLFQVKCILQNAPMPPLELPGLTLSVLDIDKKVAEFDLLLILTDTEQGIIAELKYSTDLFKAATVSQMLQNLAIILSQMVSQPDIKLDELKVILVEADQQQRLLQEQEYQKNLQQNLISIKRRSK
ncbi:MULTISPECIES: non-ribosomal peptide synthetase [unclassified Tolypothrix]|uniref:non-ribosomal peptide synthetase n=1 Tax=unclassified Tolypothrix TaxID=2649714 RepID=UPI0005EAC028|nr:MULTISPECIES: non-ribosomal peptide synthetase [unclassified Tolypothrix]EKE99927.1 AMP-binding enzyme [Tolypothrix sp. PCC 7601]MBE9081415.1 non-ribosomal peptide synthetase [Tolypothrix sp. LEGE 11397]UYD25233.1 non-ribosomal peptide synthetase [Tolypothrix sp. PCC 7712]UYD32528.1 non-ribosomal peptide synthetase [Tolypothrix sp. PCC 7601]